MRTLIAIVLCTSVSSVLAEQTSPYKITHTYLLGGDGGWDYIVPDPPNHRLFIARQTRVMVVDSDTGALIGEVPDIHGAHGTAIVERTGRGFATSGNDQSVVMFDLKTLKVLGRIPAAEDADAIIYDAASKRVFTFNGDAHSSTVIDPDAGTAITNVALGGKPEYGASAGDGKVYANLTDTSEVVEIDAKARDRPAPLVHAAVQAARGDGHRHRPPSPVQRLPQRRDGDFRLRRPGKWSQRSRSAPGSMARGSTRARAPRSPRMRTGR